MKRDYVKAIQDIALRADGLITAEAVVEAAKHKDSPLHAYFDWDDKKAGSRWRLEQARELIRSVRLEVTHTVRDVSVPYLGNSAPAFVRDPKRDHEEQGYVSVIRLRDDAEGAREAVIAEFSHAAAALARARAIAAALNLTAEIDEVHGRIIELKKRATDLRVSD